MTTLTCFDAVKIAREHAESRGFEMLAGSNLSEAVYLSLPGRVGALRIAAHSCRHPFDVVESLDFIYREAWQRDENDIGLDREGVIEHTEWAIERFMDEAEDDDDDE